MILTLLLFGLLTTEPEELPPYDVREQYPDEPTQQDETDFSTDKGEFATWLEEARRRYPPRLVLPVQEPRQAVRTAVQRPNH